MRVRTGMVGGLLLALALGGCTESYTQRMNRVFEPKKVDLPPSLREDRAAGPRVAREGAPRSQRAAAQPAEPAPEPEAKDEGSMWPFSLF